MGFWSAVKPLLSHKIKSTTETVLIEKGIVVNSPGSIVNIINAYFINVAAEIGPSDMLSQGQTMDEINRIHGVNPSVQYIRTFRKK